MRMFFYTLAMLAASLLGSAQITRAETENQRDIWSNLSPSDQRVAQFIIVTYAPSATFLKRHNANKKLALEAEMYATPVQVGPVVFKGKKYDAVFDRFGNVIVTSTSNCEQIGWTRVSTTAIGGDALTGCMHPTEDHMRSLPGSYVLSDDERVYFAADYTIVTCAMLAMPTKVITTNNGRQREVCGQ